MDRKKKRRQTAWPSHTRENYTFQSTQIHPSKTKKSIVLYSNKGTINYNQQCHPLHLRNKQYKQFPQKKKNISRRRKGEGKRKKESRNEKGKEKEKEKKWGKERKRECEREGKGEGKREETRERERREGRRGENRESGTKSSSLNTPPSPDAFPSSVPSSERARE